MITRSLSIVFRLLPAGLLLFPAIVRGDEVSFRNDVMPVLSKAGCNLGTCHGNQNGKGGFRLSLRGQSPGNDFATLTRELSARRANSVEPDRSLLLLKPTMQVPHEGGRRFDSGSVEYETLRRWIAAGMPADSKEIPRLMALHVVPRARVLVSPEKDLQLRVEATFDDGTRRDVTRLAVYEPDNQKAEISIDGHVMRRGDGETTVIVRFLHLQVPVRLAFVPAREDFVWTAPKPVNFIDDHVFAKLQSLRMNPSEVADDGTFVRRAYLDLCGILPTAEEARAFVQDPRSDKRARLIDALLERQEFADFWALKWSDLLRNEERTLDRKGVEAFHAWIRNAIAAGKPVDAFVRELIAARGSTYSHPPANYYRAMREPLMRAESTAQLFLGIRLQCAKCHNHPFDRWTQNDYYGWANLFARVDYQILENRRRDRNDQHEFDGEQLVVIKNSGNVDNPQTGRPADLRFLGDAGEKPNPRRDRLEQLADWLTSAENTRFAETQVNRIWFHLMGRGIVEPIDDFRATNPPANPQLLEALASDFVAHGYDLRHTIRTIMNSRTYQLSSVPNETNADDEMNFARAGAKRLSAEQLLDALGQVTGVMPRFNGYPPGTRAGEIPGVQAIRPRDLPPAQGDRFLKLFGKPARQQACECERTDEATLSQTFQLISGPLVSELLTWEGNRLDTLLASEKTSDAVVAELFWTALAREPRPEERDAIVTLLESADDRRATLEDVTWSLLNSAEFLLRR